MLLVVKKAVLAADHYRNLTKMYVREESLPHNPLALLCIVDECCLDTNIYKEGRRIRQIAKTCIIRHHR